MRGWSRWGCRTTKWLTALNTRHAKQWNVVEIWTKKSAVLLDTDTCKTEAYDLKKTYQSVTIEATVTVKQWKTCMQVHGETLDRCFVPDVAC